MQLPPLSAAAPPSRTLFRTSALDAWLVVLALAQGIALAAFALAAPAGLASVPAALAVAIVVWWSSNTISHIHLHHPLFRARPLNRGFSLYLTALLGIPQTLWRDRHLWHHAGEPAGGPRGGAPGALLVEIGVVGATWIAMVLAAPGFFLAAWLPGWLAGLGLCQMQGHFEHAGVGPGGISHYGWFYNRLWFNDGYHAEHHRHPAEHWTRLPERRLGAAATSAWPPVLRWLDGGAALNRAQARALEWLERLALASPLLQRFMLATHERALRTLLPHLGDIANARVCIVGGGLFPRTALVVRKLLPGARIVLLDASPTHLLQAKRVLAARGILDDVDIVHRRFDPAALDDNALAALGDVIVVPLGYRGDRDILYRRTKAGEAPAILVHEWLWRRRGRAGARISLFLLKRLNLV